VQHPTAESPNDYYTEGLRAASEEVVQAIYHEFRQPVVRAVESAGGSHADGATFFRVAVLQAAEQARQEQLPSAVPIFYWLRDVAVAQYRDWRSERGQVLPELPPPAAAEPDTQAALPDVEAMRALRQRVRAKRQFPHLDADCQQKFRASAAAETTEDVGDCLDRYRARLGEGDWSALSAAWVGALLRDEHFGKMWDLADALEHRLAAGQPLADEARPKSNFARNLLIFLLLLTTGYAAWAYFFRTKTPAEVYKANFNPPASIADDRAARYARDSVPTAMPEVCDVIFHEADEYFKQKTWREAAAVLLPVAQDESLRECHSDALFYLGIISLQLERPELTLDCFSKIQDLERFGEDIYWYQALAFVQMAAQDPTRRDVARRAVERARSNTEVAERREQAEKMLKQLAD
jgi:hypothetical protein